MKQGDPGQSMFVVLDGQVRIILEPSGQEVATTSAGGFFGEMSMLTGDPRTATVRAIGDATPSKSTPPASANLRFSARGSSTAWG
ncbi:MAG: cyclic nucleotide-binding domain-containing protein [Vicinamibacterales bacterium]